MTEVQEYIAEEQIELDSETDISENLQNEADLSTDQKASQPEGAETITQDEESISFLKETINSLKSKISELEKARDTQERILCELGDFSSLFPNVSIDDIPECVWDSVKKGTSIAASYALYEKRTEAERIRREQINSLNASKSAGIAGKDTANEYFSPEEVKKMSRAEVHANFAKIRRSMQKWT